MQNRIVVLISIFVIPFFAVSCDYVRSAIGRPTSKDIAKKRAQLENLNVYNQIKDVKYFQGFEVAQEENFDEQYYEGNKSADVSEDNAKKTDTLIIKKEEDITKTEPERTLRINPIKARLLDPFTSDYKYFIVVGSFQKRQNALNCLSKVELKGVEAQVLSLKNGYSAVAICPSNSLSEISANLRIMKKKSFCPPDAWIMMIE